MIEASIFRLRERYFDIVLLALFAVLGAVPSVLVFAQRKYTFFYQNFVPESVIWACGYGLRHPQVISDQLAAFLLGKVQSFDCSTIDPDGVFGAVGLFASVQPWITWSAALLWRALGVNQLALLPLVALLAALYAAGCYALSRLFLGRWLAVVAAAVLCVSPVATEMSRLLRDYSKAPFFIWALVFMMLALRARRGTLLFAALAGSVVGIGYGFRSDLAIVVPVGMVILLGSALAGMRGDPSRLFAPFAFVVMAGLFALPAIVQTNVVASGGSVPIQGTTEYFRDYAGIEPAGYALGWTYSDELTLSEITAIERPKIPDWDQHESQPGHGVSQAMTHSTSYLLGWAPLFAADFATQALKSAGWVLGFPSLFTRSEIPGATYSAAYLLPMYQLLAKPWMVLVTLAGFVALLWRVHLRSPAEAVCIFALLTILAGSVGIQFAMRHAFYLEFVWVLSILALVSLLRMPAFSARQLRGFAAMVAVIAAFVAGAYLGLVEWQRTALSREIATLVAAPREVLATQRSARQDGGVLHALAVPARHAAIVAAASDSLTPAIRLTGVPSDVRAEADRLMVTIGGDRCPRGAFKIRLAYEATKDTWQPLDADLSLDVSTQGGRASAFFPAFYRPTQHFSGVVLPASHAGCEVDLELTAGLSALPLAMSGQVSQDGLVGPLTKGFGGFCATAHTPGIIGPAPK